MQSFERLVEAFKPGPGGVEAIETGTERLEYEGNRNDVKQFSAIIGRFHVFFRELAGTDASPQALTVVFDKGNNSAENFALLDHLGLHFVGSLKLDEHKDLMRVGNDDARFQVLAGERWQGAKAFRLTRKIGGKERTFVMTYNPKLFHAQWLTGHSVPIRTRLDEFLLATF